MRRVLWIAAVWVAAAAAVMIFARPGPAPISDLDGILFHVRCNGADRLFAIRPDGSGLRPILWAKSWGTVFSPDGSCIATTFEDRVFLHGPDGTRQLAAGGDLIITPVLSPDSRLIATVALKDDVSEVSIEDVNGGSPHVFNVRNLKRLAFSPDGKHLALVTGDYKDESIFIADHLGRNPRFLTYGRDPVFSPDGAYVAYTFAPGHLPDLIYLVDVEGKNDRLFTPDNSRAFDPVFSPDGTKVLFRGEEEGSSDVGLYVIGVDGTNQRRICDGPLVVGAAFSPDGQSIAYSTESGVFVTDINGTTPTLLTERGGGDLYWGRVPDISAPSHTGFPGLPKHYYVDQIIRADLDDDGRKEQVCTAGFGYPPGYGAFSFEVHERKPLLVIVAKDDVPVHTFKHRHMDTLLGLRAIDLTGDGVPELAYRAESYGASSGTVEHHIYRWAGRGFKKIAGGPYGTFCHLLEGGLVALGSPSGKPRTLVLYDFIWGDDECHADPHRYWAEYYEIREAKARMVMQRETKRRYHGEHPLSEFGIVVPSTNAIEL